MISQPQVFMLSLSLHFAPFGCRTPQQPLCCPGSIAGAPCWQQGACPGAVSLGGLRDLGSTVRSCTWPQAHQTPCWLVKGCRLQFSSGTMWTWAAPHHHPGVTRAYLHGKLLYNSWVHLSWKRPSRSSLVESHRADKQEASTFLLVWARF